MNSIRSDTHLNVSDLRITLTLGLSVDILCDVRMLTDKKTILATKSEF